MESSNVFPVPLEKIKDDSNRAITVLSFTLDSLVVGDSAKLRLDSMAKELLLKQEAKTDGVSRIYRTRLTVAANGDWTLEVLPV